MNDSLSLIPICSQPYAQRHVRMEVIVQLQIPAAVLVVGLETLVVKVCECMQVLSLFSTFWQ